MLPQDLKNYRAPEDKFGADTLIFWLTVIIVIGAILVTTGCSTMPQDLIAHEEMHCNGWSHTGEPPFYVWKQERAPSVKPWLYIPVSDVDQHCRSIMGSQAISVNKIYACATWKPANCEIYLPSN